MASHVGRVIQDQNLNFNYNGASAGGKANVSKASRKGVLGGRKPLSDLSNSVKRTSPKQSFKKHNSNIFSVTEKEIGASKITFDGSKKKSVSRATEKIQTSNRKALSDISNSERPNLDDASKKNLNAKLSVATGEHLSAIAEEKFLHNHEGCMKSQMRAMDIDDFMRTIGLHNGPLKQSASPRVRSPRLDKLEPASPPRYLDLDEIPEPQLADSPSLQKHKPFFELDSSPPCRSPRSPEQFMQWEDVNFMLIKTP